jgi:predicted enzyme related to lactoylglutathione lyase
MSTPTPGRILGIGGIFFKSPDRDNLSAWYRDKLGIDSGQWGAMLKWRSAEDNAEHMTIWSIFKSDTDYLNPSKASFMINYIVDDLDAFLEKLRVAGVEIDPKRQDEDYGRFAWTYDPDGNKIELWQPK